MQVIVENPNTIVIDVDQGRQGRGIQNITYTEVSGQYFLIVTYTDGTTETLGPLVVTGGAAFLLGGATGSIPYQSAPNTTVFLPIGTQNQVVVAGATVPQYTSALTGLTVNNSAIGNTTPSTGAFTNLSASGTFALTGDQVQISEGGTGQTTANGAFNALAPSQTGNAGKYLKTDGTNSSWDQLDISTADITGTLPIANGGTGQTTANSALNALLPTQAAQSGKYLKTDGTNASWDQLDISTADITGVLPVANGGTGASTAAGARANLSAAILGTNNDITSLTGITGGISTPDFVQFDTTATEANAVGKVYWDASQGTLDLGLLGGNVVSRIGQSLVAYVTNAEAVTITKGQVVYLFGAQGDRATVKLAYNTSDATSAKTFGVVAENIPANGTGFVMCQGVLEGLNLGAFTAGDTLYLGATPGSLTATKPYAPNHLVYVGLVERANAGNGQLYVKVQNGYELDEIHDVQIINPQNGQTIIYDASTSLWKNANLTAGSGISVTNGAASITVSNTGVLSFSGGTTGLTPSTSTTGAVTLGGTLNIASGGTGQTTANDSFNALAPSQTGNAGKYLKTDGTNSSWDLLDISTSDITGTLPVANGGTGATTAAGALTNLNAASQSTTISAGTGLTGGGDLSTNRTISIANTTVTAGAYGSASDTLTATVNAQGQLTALAATPIAIANTQISGLGTMSTQNASSVSITGGTITGITDLAVADGGTGASDASTARSNLGAAASATTISAGTGLSGGGDLSANRTLSIANTTVTAGAYGSASNTLTATVNAQGQLTALAATPIAIANTQISGLGTMSTQNSNSVTITGGSITGITDLAIADGGTGASDAPTARTNLGLGTSATLNAGVALGVATLDAGGTVPLSQLPASIQGGVSYQGSWNAATNTPTIVSGVGSKGYYYVVSVAGSTNIDGITDWLPGDWIIYNGTVWQKIDNTDAVASVNGYTGVVVLNSADVGAPPTSRTITAGTGLTGGGDLSANRTISIDNTTVTSGSYGSASSVGTFTVNGQGQLTAAASTPIAITNTQVSGLGTMSTQNASAVAITGGSITGITDLAVTDGGTGASDAATARTNLGAAASAINISAGTGLSGGGDLSANRTLSIANTTVTAASYGSASSVGTFTVNAQGQLTAAASTPIAIANTQVSGLGTMSTQNANAVAITGGSIDGVTIGGSTTGAGSFTTLTTSSTVTLNGGTANGVAYLNGSKVLTTGSALTFDGTNLSNTRSLATAFSGANAATWVNGIALTNTATPATGVSNLITFGGTSNVYSVFGVTQGSSSYGEFVWAGYSGSFSEQMRLTSTSLYTASGINVGIGTVPTQKFEVYKAAGDTLVYGSNPRLVLTAPTGMNGIRVNADTTPLELLHLSDGSQVSVGGNMDMTINAANATAGSTFKNSPTLAFLSKYWNGSASASQMQGFIGMVSTAATTTGGYFGLGIGSPGTITIDSANNVGVGLVGSSTYGKLAVAGTIAQWANVAIGAELNRIQWYNTGTNYDVASIRTFIGAGQVNRGEFGFYTNNGAGQQLGLYIDRTQQVGVGTNTPLAALDVFGVVRLDNGTTQSNYFATLQAQYNSSNPFVLKVENNIGGTAAAVFGVYSPGGGGSVNPCFPLNNATGVGIGTTSPAAALHVSGNNGPVRISGSGYVLNPTQFTLGQYTSVRGYIQVPGGSTGQFEVWDGATNAVAIFNAYGMGLYGSTPTSGAGITFPASQQASSDANTLDDYEEGTWTPTLIGSGGASGQSYTHQRGRYTKIGNLVTISFDVQLSDRGTLSGTAQISGLPFSSTTSPFNYKGFANIGYWNSLNTGYVFVSLTTPDGNSQLIIRANTAASGNIVDPDATDFFTNATRLIGGATYMVS